MPRPAPKPQAWDQDDILRRADAAITQLNYSRAARDKPWDGCVGVGLCKAADVHFQEPAGRSTAAPDAAAASEQQDVDEPPPLPHIRVLRDAETVLRVAAKHPWLRSLSSSSADDSSSDLLANLQDSVAASAHTQQLIDAANSAAPPSPPQQRMQRALTAALERHVHSTAAALPRERSAPQNAAAAEDLMRMLQDELAMDRKHGRGAAKGAAADMQQRWAALGSSVSASYAPAEPQGSGGVDELLEQLQLESHLQRRAPGQAARSPRRQAESQDAQAEELLRQVVAEPSASLDSSRSGTEPPESSASGSIAGDADDLEDELPAVPAHAAEIKHPSQPQSTASAALCRPPAQPRPAPGLQAVSSTMAARDGAASSPAVQTPADPALAALTRALDLQKKAAWVLNKPPDAKRASFLSALHVAAYRLAAESLKAGWVEAAEMAVTTALSAVEPGSDSAARANMLALAVQRCKLRQLQHQRTASAVPWEEQQRLKAQRDVEAYVASLPSVPRP